MQLKILSFSGKGFSHDNVISATLMTWIGEITILENHSPLLSYIKPSTMYIIYKDENSIEHRDDFAILSWVVEVRNNKVKIMTGMLVDIENIHKGKSERAKEEALKLMEKYKDAKDRVDMEKFIEAEDLLQKSIIQSKLYDLKK